MHDPKGYLKPFLSDLDALETKHRRRSLRNQAGHDFASNDYLGLAGSPRLKKAVTAAVERGVPVGAGGSRLLRGNTPEHEALEAEAARFFGAERALYFSNGFMANYALLATLPQRPDLVVSDKLIHASCHDGMRVCRAETRFADHNDPNAFEDQIVRWRRSGGTGRAWIFIESVYSMDGDHARLADFFALADRHEAFLVVDEAHATGVLGAGGRGLTAGEEGRENLIVLHTCGKALGAAGALICAPTVLCDFLVNRSRPFIFSTAPSPLVAAAVREALKIVADEPERREALRQRVEHAGQLLSARCGVSSSGSHIQPIIVGADSAALGLAAALQDLGFDIRPIRPPTVPEGTARLRMALTLNISLQTITDLIDNLATHMKQIA